MLNQYEKQIKKLLSDFGFLDSDILVFLTGIKIGPSTIIQLAQETQLGRITTHKIVEKLLEKGLFLQTSNKRHRLVYPHDLHALEKILENKKNEISKLEHKIEKAKPLFDSLKSQSENLPHVRFYKGKEGLQLMINEIISDQKNMYVICDSRHFYDLIDNQFLERSMEIRKKYNLTTKMLFPMGFEYFCFSQGVYEQKLNIRELPDSFKLIGALNIWGNKTGFHCQKGDFITTTIIEDEQISQILVFLFENVWSGAKEY